jgi:hypothetical protein
MKKQLLSALIAVTAAGSLIACSHDKTKADNMSAAPAPTSTSSADTSASTSQPEVAAMETNTTNTTPPADNSANTQQQTQDYEKSQRK